MKVDSINNNSYIFDSRSTVDQVRDSLQKLADQHSTTVEELVKSAKSAGIDAPSYLIRALNLQARLEKLEKSN